jgi:hypothetical protein
MQGRPAGELKHKSSKAEVKDKIRPPSSLFLPPRAYLGRCAVDFPRVVLYPRGAQSISRTSCFSRGARGRFRGALF